jgi:colicin import membrane protein
MKRLIAVFVLFSLAGALQAQVGSRANDLDPSIALDAERARIQAQRDVIGLEFEKQEAGCYQKFAVNDCLTRIRMVRRDAMADLRRQELSLNAAEARRKAAEQLARIEEKSSAQALQDEADRVAEAQRAQLERQRVFDEKAAERAVAATEAIARQKEAQEREVRRAEALADRTAKANSAAEEQKNYDAKVFEAQKKQADNLKKRAENQTVVKPLPRAASPSTSKPLPVPP